MATKIKQIEDALVKCGEAHTRFYPTDGGANKALQHIRALQEQVDVEALREAFYGKPNDTEADGVILNAAQALLDFMGGDDA